MKRILYLLAFATMWGCNDKPKNQGLTMTTENTAMVMVDVQYGFFQGSGELPTTADDSFTGILEKNVDKFQKAGYKVLYTKDSHSKDHISYGENHDKENFEFTWNGYTEQYVYKKTTSGDCYSRTAITGGIKVLNPIVYKIEDKLYQEVDYGTDISNIGREVREEQLPDNAERRALINKKLVPLDKSHEALLQEGWVQQRLWSKHCTENTAGEKLVGKLESMVDKNFCVYKGKSKNIESYSGVKDELGDDLGLIGLIEKQLGGGEKSKKTIVAFGVATDVCVKATAMDLKEAGYHVIVVSDLSRGVHEEEPSVAINAMRENGIEVISLKELEGRLRLTAAE